jgi:hypothetical protein
MDDRMIFVGNWVKFGGRVRSVCLVCIWRVFGVYDHHHETVMDRSDVRIIAEWFAWLFVRPWLN